MFQEYRSCTKKNYLVIIKIIITTIITVIITIIITIIRAMIIIIMVRFGYLFSALRKPSIARPSLTARSSKRSLMMSLLSV